VCAPRRQAAVLKKMMAGRSRAAKQTRAHHIIGKLREQVCVWW
jgi:hypothetical protein